MSLLQLPLEVRNQIFSYVLTSPSGLIFLYDLQLLESMARRQLPLGSGFTNAEPEDSESRRFLISTVNGPNGPKKLSLAFLRTCKEIYEEAKDLKPFWQNNTFHLSPSINEVAKFPAIITSQIQDVEMEFDMCPSSDKLSKQEQDLRVLRSWKSLKSISLSVWPQIKNDDLFWKKFEHCKNCWSSSSASHYMYIKTLRSLNEAGGTKGYLSHLQRQICLPLRKKNFAVEGASPRVFFSAEDGDPNKTLEDWATAFGGRLLVDGMVCYDEWGRLIG
jgi:hypothetical protein